MHLDLCVVLVDRNRVSDHQASLAGHIELRSSVFREEISDRRLIKIKGMRDVAHLDRSIIVVSWQYPPCGGIGMQL